MARAFSEIAFTPTVRSLQSRHGSRQGYAPLDHARERGDTLSAAEEAFIAQRDGFYLASVSETGWPYVQYKGGPAGFLKVLDPRHIAYADFRGNVQYISAGNMTADGRVSLILMDYAQRRRLKLWARARLVEADEDPSLMDRLRQAGYAARVERAVVMQIEAFDWNCPQHITLRYTEHEIAMLLPALHTEISALRAELARLRDASPELPRDAS